MKAVNCHLSMSCSAHSKITQLTPSKEEARGVADSRVDEDEDVSGLAMHDLQQGCS